MIISSSNEWSKLRSVVVGSAAGANWPSDDIVFSQEHLKTSWKETPVPAGPVPQHIIDETNEDLETLVDIFKQANVEVYRPHEVDFVATHGMYNYCPRDRLIIAGDRVIDPTMMYPCREQEIEALDFVCKGASKVLRMPRNSGMVLDAANVCRLNDTWLYLLSASGNIEAANWLQEQLPEIKIETCNFYSGVHIDSTIAPLRDGIVMLNASRVTPQNCPKVFDGWTKLWVHDLVPQDFYQYPYASKWIGLNVLSIDDNTVIVDAAQTKLIKDLENMKFVVVPAVLRHSRTLGGAFHCATLDLHRGD